MNVLFATSEVFPLIKTGGLADVSSGLPLALKQQGDDVRLILPGYPDAMAKGGRLKEVASFSVPKQGRLLQGRLPNSKIPVWFVDIPDFFQRVGGPYGTASGQDWPDNPERFAAFSKVIVAAALNQLNLDWQPDVVHCNDWQTGLVPALLHEQPTRPVTVFTIHNLAYQGVCSYEKFSQLDLPESLWNMEGIEFHGRCSFLKGGIAYADHITTVSPSYAKEIRTPQFGYGLQGLLEHRSEHLTGILNGIDTKVWNPARDALLPYTYSANDLAGKAANKRELQSQLGLPERDDVPLIGIVGRIVEQKGYDLVLQALPRIFQHNVQLVMLGSGDRLLETALEQAISRYPAQMSLTVGYDEKLSHLIEAGSDMFLMPSRFEPCGLNQLYSLRYGSVPIVHHTGGLIDSVVDTTHETLSAGTATGFHFYQTTADALIVAIQRALELYGQPENWHKLVFTGMLSDNSWARSGEIYQNLYQTLRKSQGVHSSEDAL